MTPAATGQPAVTLLLATTNTDKLREIRALVSAASVTVLSLADTPPIDAPDETGTTFVENARLKAQYYDRLLADRVRAGDSRSDDRRGSRRLVTVAEDSGLVIDALGGEPGIRSARFVGPDATYPDRFDEIYRRLAANPGHPRTARFVCAVAAVEHGECVFDTTGLVEGEIAPVPRGTAGFGYDPIFYYPPYAATLAEVDDAAKRAVAHRGHAFRSLIQWLRQ